MTDQRWGDPWAASPEHLEAAPGKAGAESPTTGPAVPDPTDDTQDTIDLTSLHAQWSAPRASETDELWSAYLGETPARDERRRAGLRLAAVAVAAALVGGAAGAGAALYATRDERSPLDPSVSLGAPSSVPRDVAPDSVAGVAARLLPSVVSIDVGNGTGSGVIIRSDGYVLTNNHVVAGATRMRVTLASGKVVDASLVGRDPLTDLAVIRVEATGLPPAALGTSSSLRVGDPVVAIGSPLGLTGTVTSGIVSALNRTVDEPSSVSLFNLIQTDAAINPGNSGGALADRGGNLVGINTAIAALGGGSIGLGFAIPIDEARSVAEQIIATGRATHPYLGIGPDTLTPEAAQRFGVEAGAVVATVYAGGPADRAGIRVGDVIVAFDGVDVDNAGELIVEIRKQSIGDQVDVVIVRDGERRTVRVTLAERPTSP